MDSENLAINKAGKWKPLKSLRCMTNVLSEKTTCPAESVFRLSWMIAHKKVRWNHCEAQAMNKNGLRNFWTSSEKQMPRKVEHITTHHAKSIQIIMKDEPWWSRFISLLPLVA